MSTTPTRVAGWCRARMRGLLVLGLNLGRRNGGRAGGRGRRGGGVARRRRAGEVVENLGFLSKVRERERSGGEEMREGEERAAAQLSFGQLG